MMPGPTLRAALSGMVEEALNRTLALDPAGHQALLAALRGTVQFRLTAPLPLTLTLSASADRVRVGSVEEPAPAIEIAGRPLAFLALAQGDDQVFSDGRLTVHGDMAQAHQFQRALDRLNPDWEASLAKVMGDVPAHFLGRRLRAALQWSRQASAALNANVEEYIHEESRALPGRRELEATFHDIDELHLRTERLAARLDHLTDAPRSSETQ
ncbi:MAG: SCP2 sterol-binding domain-containing protein [Pseudomonadales bacterium]|uniref:ubiquinone biosynthesis accessory factor UbiJ n=1 Tax=Marinobacter xestospongiae TaxID=994319 RepID=UPI002006B83D|nr:SCP2 sterol-binding domain-containing protein [Marinobacter xestospongiae]MCG8516872.1 SCP2 sterol-binding domain-containing protein [Pseudomonadales bacterium]MCK7568355.1 SCP2 sterol-binding domain-containing protein [Marinobacter xestospongiae]